MAVSLAGLDLDFMRKNPLPPREKRRQINFAKPAENVSRPYFVADIKPFVSCATKDTVEITSRSQLRAYERANDIRQCGDWKPGQIVGDQNSRIEKATYVSPEDKAAADFKWTD